jgi:hypothetical protein
MPPRRTRQPEYAGATGARESLERRWFRQFRAAPEFAALVTGQQLPGEPRHRWLPYKQGFAPGLVRQFLSELKQQNPNADGPVLDPFSGSGTTQIECARQGVPSLGVEALPVLTFVGQQKAAADFHPIPNVGPSAEVHEFAAHFIDPLHRAALICAVARRHTSDGRPLQNAPALRAVLLDVLREVRADLQESLAAPVDIQCGDARHLRHIASQSVSGILTSPPYLSRHDYTRITRPLEDVYRHWYAGGSLPAQRQRQVRAHPQAYRQQWQHPMPAAVDEACVALEQARQAKLAGIVRSYFQDTYAALCEMSRVLRPAGMVWLIIGGARLKDVYVPSDLILAELATTIGFRVTELRVARRLTDVGRKLGGLHNIAPRESILVIERRPG